MLGADASRTSSWAHWEWQHTTGSTYTHSLCHGHCTPGSLTLSTCQRVPLFYTPCLLQAGVSGGVPEILLKSPIMTPFSLWLLTSPHRLYMWTPVFCLITYPKPSTWESQPLRGPPESAAPERADMGRSTHTVARNGSRPTALPRQRAPVSR